MEQGMTICVKVELKRENNTNLKFKVVTYVSNLSNNKIAFPNNISLCDHIKLICGYSDNNELYILDTSTGEKYRGDNEIFINACGLHRYKCEDVEIISNIDDEQLSIKSYKLNTSGYIRDIRNNVIGRCNIIALSEKGIVIETDKYNLSDSAVKVSFTLDLYDDVQLVNVICSLEWVRKKDNITEYGCYMISRNNDVLDYLKISKEKKEREQVV